MVALLFLFHTGVDLLFPQLCSEEPVDIAISQSLPVTEETTIDEAYAPVAVSLPKDSREDQRPDPQHSDEDCFCCCTHVMPSPLFVAPGDADPGLMTSRDQNTSIPAAPPNNPYHPPRFV